MFRNNEQKIGQIVNSLKAIGNGLHAPEGNLSLTGPYNSKNLILSVFQSWIRPLSNFCILGITQF